MTEPPFQTFYSLSYILECSLSLMASKVSVASLYNFSISIDCTKKKFLKNPNLILPSLNTSGFCSITKVPNSSQVTTSSSRRGELPYAVKEEEVQTIQTQFTETDPSSSKLVLVAGGTGGVGMDPFSLILFLHFLYFSFDFKYQSLF